MTGTEPRIGATGACIDESTSSQPQRKNACLGAASRRCDTGRMRSWYRFCAMAASISSSAFCRPVNLASGSAGGAGCAGAGAHGGGCSARHLRALWLSWQPENRDQSAHQRNRAQPVCAFAFSNCSSNSNSTGLMLFNSGSQYG